MNRGKVERRWCQSRWLHSELDELRSISRNAKQIIATLEATERERSGIGSLRIRFNNVFGYYIEVSKANAARVPADYERRQTLANAERFTTPELKEWEKKVLGAEERMTQLEAELFNDLCRQIAAQTKRLQATARALATLDVVAALAETAVRRRFVQPTVHDGDEIEIIAGRHPSSNSFNEEPFVPNGIYLNNSTNRLLVITGPNMGGKSTVLRQTRSSASSPRWVVLFRRNERACRCWIASGHASALPMI